jgi:NADPH-dependent 2,4-dienoyl-CoA reductase/sulfur reductase-like enzyme
MRLTLEVIQHIRSRVGNELPILIRISGAEYGPGGRTIEETQYMAPLFVEAGVDAFLVSAGTVLNAPWLTSAPSGTPLAANAPLTRAIKKVVNVPVICVGRITNPWIAENVLAMGDADMVGMARALLADPEFPNKAFKGNWEDITPCVGDLACLVSLGSDKKICCLTNPAIGQEEEMALIPAKNPKNILVVGGGPAGLEAARIARLRGHDVTLLEKTSKLGGQLLIASVPPMKQELTHIVQYLATQVYQVGVKVELNREVTPEVVKRINPEVIIVATGGTPLLPREISGTDGKNVVTAWEVLKGRALVGQKAIVVGGGKVGCEVADFIAHPVNDLNPRGNRVTVIEMLEHVALDEASSSRSLLIQSLLSKGVRMITSAKVIEILADGVKYLKDGREETIRGMDTIVLAMGTRSFDPLSEKLKGGPVPTFVIGDAKEPRKAVEAIAEGSEIARRI